MSCTGCKCSEISCTPATAAMKPLHDFAADSTSAVRRSDVDIEAATVDGRIVVADSDKARDAEDTSGSRAMMLAIRCCNSDMFSNEISGAASVTFRRSGRCPARARNLSE